MQQKRLLDCLSKPLVQLIDDGTKMIFSQISSVLKVFYIKHKDVFIRWLFWIWILNCSEQNGVTFWDETIYSVSLHAIHTVVYHWLFYIYWTCGEHKIISNTLASLDDCKTDLVTAILPDRRYIGPLQFVRKNLESWYVWYFGYKATVYAYPSLASNSYPIFEYVYNHPVKYAEYPLDVCH